MQGSLTVSPSVTVRWRGEEVKGGGCRLASSSWNRHFIRKRHHRQIWLLIGFKEKVLL